MDVDRPLSTRPDRFSGSGARFSSPASTRTRTVAVSTSEGAPTENTEYEIVCMPGVLGAR